MYESPLDRERQRVLGGDLHAACLYRADNLQAEVERLQAALEKLCDESEHPIRQGDTFCPCRRARLA